MTARKADACDDFKEALRLGYSEAADALDDFCRGR
jgi:hypothetical protein